MSDAMAIWQCFPWTEMIYPQADRSCCKGAWLFSFRKLAYSIKTLGNNDWFSVYSWHSTWNCLLPESSLFCNTAYTIQVWYVTAKIQMPSNSHSGERKTGNAVNYFRLAWISLDKQLVVKESIMHWWWSLVNENVNRFHKYFQLHRYFIGVFFWC